MGNEESKYIKAFGSKKYRYEKRRFGILFSVFILAFMAIFPPLSYAASTTLTPYTGSDTSDNIFNVTLVQTDDGNRDLYVLPTSYNETKYQEYLFNFTVPADSSISAVTITFSWAQKKVGAAKLEVYDGTTWFNHTIGTATTFNVTGEINNPAKVNAMKIRFLAYGPGNASASVDFVQVAVTYTTPNVQMTPNNTAYQSKGATASYLHTITSDTDTITLSSVSNQSFATRIYLDADGNGIKDSPTPITQVVFSAEGSKGIIVEVDIPSSASGTDITTVTATGTSGPGDTASVTETSNIIEPPPSGLVDGLKEADYTAPYASYRFFNYGPDPNMASGVLYSYVRDGVLHVYYEQNARNINDNTYGTWRQAGWAGQQHSLDDLAVSDKTEFIFYDDSGNVKLSFFADYVSAVTPSTSYPAGYHCLGFAGGDGEMLINSTGIQDLGQLASLITFESSMAFNLNHYTSTVGGTPTVDCGQTYGTVDLLVNSPPIDTTFYDVLCPNATEYEMSYAIEFSIPIYQVFPNEPVIDIVARAHNSPSKLKDRDNPPVKATAVLGDTVWYDWNSDGIKDSFENGIPGARVMLYWDQNGDGVFSDEELLTETYTDDEGRYLFPGIFGGIFYDVKDTLHEHPFYSGDYRVVIDESAVPPGGSPNPVYGYTRTAPVPFPFVLSDTISGANRGTLGVEEAFFGADFGYRPQGAVIGDFVWADCDNDGVQDNGEMGVAGVTIDLIDVATSLAIATTTTNAQGKYLFYGLDPGTYQVSIRGENFSAGGVLYGYTLSAGPNSQTNPTSDILAEQNSYYLQADFGYYSNVCGTIGDAVYFNSDWTPRGGENPPPYTGGDYGLANVTLGIWEDSNHNGLRDITDKYIGGATTDSNGYYVFKGLPVSSSGVAYIIQVTDLNNVLGNFEKFYPGGGLFATLTTSAPENLGVDFPYVAVGVIGDFVWNDLDHDGIQDDGEPGIAGVTMKLEYWNTDLATPDWVVRGIAATDASGKYYFSGLRTTQPDGTASQYRVTLTDTNGVLAGWTNSPSGQGGDPSKDSNDPTILNYLYLGGTTAPLYPHNNLTIDFGFYNSNGVFGSIGDYIWSDVNGDMLQDIAETGFGSVSLELRDADTDNLIQSTTTLSDGHYHFAGLPVSAAGVHYKVVVTDINGVLSGYSMTTDPAALNVVLTTSAPNVTTADAGYKPIPTLARITAFEAYHNQGRVVIKWETAAENNTIGFYLFRLNETKEAYESVNAQLVPALVGSPIGGTYRLVDRDAVPGGKYSYILTEVENRGARMNHGPFTVVVAEDGVESSVDAFFSTFSREPHEMSSDKKVRILAAKNASGKAKLSKMANRSDTGLSGVSGKIKMSVSGDGLYYVDAAAIAALLGTTVDYARGLIASKGLSVSNMGESIAYLPATNMSGIFFYGQQIGSNYTKENIYWLDTKTRGVQMGSVRNSEKVTPAPGEISFTEKLHLEENLLPATSLFTMDEDVDFWFWGDVFAGYDTREFSFTLSGKANTESDAVLSVHLQGATDFSANPDHHVMVSLNGTRLAPAVQGSDKWDGMEQHTVDFTFSQNLLSEGANTITVEGATDTGAEFSLFLIDSFDLTFRKLYKAENNVLSCRGDSNSVVSIQGFTNPDIKVFNVTDPKRPKLFTSTSVSVSGGTYCASFVPESSQARYLALTSDAVKSAARTWKDVPSGLKSSKGADYLIITVSELKDTAQRLAAYRSGQGLAPMVVDLEDVMDEFNAGIFDPRVMRDFLSYAYSRWTKAPKYVVLAGDGTYDYKDYLGYGGNLIAPVMTGTPDGLFPSDNYIADINGDHLPEMAVGRLPVLNAEELDGMISKIIGYENSGGGDWTKHVVMLSGDYDTAGDFPDDSDAVASLLPGGYSMEKIYLSQYPLSEARQRLFAQLGTGAVLLNYVGHSSPVQFGDYMQGLILSSDVGSMSNVKLPVVAGMTCFVGNFAYPEADSVSEVLTTKENGGAIAVWSPSGMSLNSEAVILDKEFFLSAFSGTGKTLGEAVLDALRQYRIKASEAYMMDIYGILGDPALRLK